jgi:hypothetical protein
MVSYSAAFGLYSSLDLLLSVNLFGVTYKNFRINVTPFAFNPISVSASWTHPIAVSQGEDMSSTIDIGYDLAVGDVQLYTFMDDLVPFVSIVDYIKDTNKKLYPTSLSGKTLMDLTNSQAAKSAPSDGWGWSNEYAQGTWVADPFAAWSFSDWLNENTEMTVTTSGNYIDTIDLFAAYNEEQEL